MISKVSFDSIPNRVWIFFLCLFVVVNYPQSNETPGISMQGFRSGNPVGK